ncbi:MAG: PTS sugar transporter subunit IIC [Leptolinea sp.]|jgi:PTS system cellobiose-specific IIC component|nr:PTS sugar transporter subunit IIC [Leptolinea sp.]
MENFINSLQKRLMPFAEKLSNNNFLSALGRTFQLLLPVIIIGSFACLGAFLDIPFWQSFVTSTGLQPIFMNIQSVTLSMIALYVIIFFSYEYGQKIGVNPVSAAIVSLIAFMLITPTEIYTNIPMQWLGYPGLFCALIIGGVVPKFMKYMYDKKIYVRMPAGVPKIIEDAFASLVPAIVVTILSITLAKLLTLTTFGNLHNVIYTLIQTPLQGFGLSLPAYLTMQVICTLLMFCGIHGNTVFSLFTPLTMAASAENLAALQAGQPLPNIITSSFSVLCQPGGIGCTFGLAFLLTFLAKSERLKTLGKMSIVPAIFGINEPLIFGIPILLNPLLFIPYVLSPIVCTVLSYISIATGITPHLTGVEVNWTMPQFVSGFIAQGWQTTVLQIVNVALTTLIWYPFFRIVDRQITAEEKSSVSKAAA